MPILDIETLFCRSLHHSSDRMKPGDPVGPSIVPTSVYFLPGEPSAPHQYGRWTNPTWSALEEALATLEAADTVIFPSGMTAIAAVLYSQLKAGDSILIPSDGYYTTRAFAEKYLTKFGVKVSTCPTAEYSAMDFSEFRLVWIETPSNPGLELCDVRDVATRAKQTGAIVIADNTTLGPLGQRPLDLDADAIVSSATKAINGHSDVLFGYVASRKSDLIGQVREWRTVSGAIPGPFETWLVHRGLETLEVRFDRMCSSAEIIASRLAEHPKVQSVSFPGLSSHPSYSIAVKQMLRFGTLIAVTFADKPSAERFINECRFVRPTTSFGGVHTSAERRARWGDKVPEGFVRLSIGCEPTETLWKDIKAVVDSL